MSSQQKAIRLNQELGAAIHRHERGRLAEAETIYRQILEQEPDHPVATEKLGVLYMQVGRAEVAEKLLRKVVAQRPDYADAHSNLGVVLASTGRLAEALACHKRALALGMDTVLAHLNIGLTLKELGQWTEALTHLRKASGITGPNRRKWMLALGEALFRCGDANAAETTLANAVEIDRKDAEALDHLARVQIAKGKHAAAIETYRSLLELRPGDIFLLEGIARAQAALNDLDTAISTMREVLGKAPSRVDSAVELAGWLHRAGRPEEGLEILRKLLRSYPDAPNIHNGLGAILHNLQRNEEAAAHFREVVKASPSVPHGYHHLALALHALGRKTEAAAAAAAAVACDENFIDALIVRGRALHEIGFPHEAAECMRKVLSLRPHHADALVNLSHIAREQGRSAEAVGCAREALLADPANLPARVAYAVALEADGRFDEAEREMRDLLTKHEDSTLYAGLGNVLKSRWQMAESVAAYRKALSFPDVSLAFGGNLMLALNYLEEIDRETVFADHKAFGARIEAGIVPMPPRPAAPDDDDPDRPLRIGYISADFRGHVVMNFMEPILSRHDRRRFAVTLYAEVMVEDQVSAYLKSLGHKWVRTIGMTDEEVAKRIREDKIDILIDLSGHTAGNRLRALAYRPAPVQGTYLGYPNTTGMSRIDFRLIDAISDPPGDADRFATEKLVRLPGCFLCFRIPMDAPPVNEAPCVKNGYVTFGSFNKLAKITPSMLDTWARILKRVPNSRLSIKGWSMADAEARDRIVDLFRHRGIEGDRIVPKPFIHDRHYMTGFHEVDIALDTNPYSGTTTTFDSLIMGVPVVTLRGDRHSARVSASMLTRLGSPEWVAGDHDEYVEIAVRLASDMARLAAIRNELRDRVAASPLADGEAFTAALEDTLREVWRTRPRVEAPAEPVTPPPSDPSLEPPTTLVEHDQDTPVPATPRAPLPPQIASRFWTQRIALPSGVVTPGLAPLAPEAFDLPDRMDGMIFFDLDARDGYWCFEAIRRGAAKAIGLHWAGPGRPPYLDDAPANFDFAREQLGIPESRCIRLPYAPDDPRLADLEPADLVLFPDLKVDWRNPLAHLLAAARICRGEFLVESAVSDARDDGGPPTFSFDPTSPGEKPAIPNLAMLGVMIESAGFTDAEGWLLHESPGDPALRRGFVKARGPAVSAG